MKKIYKRIRVNKELLKSEEPSYDTLFQNEVNDTLPTGKVLGVYFNSYITDTPTNNAPPPLEMIMRANVVSIPNNAISHTDITIKDSRGRPLTEPTSIQDYQHKGGGYNEGFKELDFESQNERITIAWETIGQQPICGEFIFEIEAPEKC